MTKEGTLLERLKNCKEDLMLGKNAWKTTHIVDLIDEVIEELEGQTWIPLSSGIMPEEDKYILVSFENMKYTDIARASKAEDGSVTFYPGGENIPYSVLDLKVNAWRKLPEQYKEGLA